MRRTCFYGLIYGVHLDIGGAKKDMAILMSLNYNGQAITLANKFAEKGVKDGAGLTTFVNKNKAKYTFAQTFPTGTHEMWLLYWLATYGIDPFKDIKNITVPPLQMVANMRVGNMDGYCVSDPWNNHVIFDKIGFTIETSQGIWRDHPEKVLGTTGEFATKYPNTARALTATILNASKYIDVMANRKKAAETIADKAYGNCPVDVIDQRLQGQYDSRAGKKWIDADYMKFYNEGLASYPYLSDGMWFLTRHKC